MEIKDVISYEPFWNTLEKSDYNWYSLVHNKGLSPDLLHRLKHNAPVSTKTLDRICDILDCDFGDIVTHIPDEPSDIEKKKEPDAE